MHLDGGSCDALDGIVDGHGGVAVASCVDDDPVEGKPHLLDFVYYLPLDIGLEIVYLHFGELISKVGKEIFEAGASIDIGFSGAQEVEVWAVDDDELFHVGKGVEG